MNKIVVPLVLLSFSLVQGALAATQDVIKECMDCHGQDGVSSEPDVPTIAGMSAVYIVDTMVTYVDGDRPALESKYRGGDTSRAPTDMAKIAKQLDEATTEEVAAYFAGKTFVPAKQSFDAAQAEAGAKIHKSGCEKCHEDGGSSPDDDAGFLAGQWMDYLRQTFADYKSGERAMPKKMQPKMDELSDADVEALIHYYGSLQ